jgi:hypothetical protein
MVMIGYEKKYSKSKRGPEHYLAVFNTRNVHAYHEKQEGQKSRQACKGVNLLDRQISPCHLGRQRNPKRDVVTDPYCPSVWKMTSDDFPLVSKISDELPTTS